MNKKELQNKKPLQRFYMNINCPYSVVLRDYKTRNVQCDIIYSKINNFLKEAIHAELLEEKKQMCAKLPRSKHNLIPYQLQELIIRDTPKEFNMNLIMSRSTSTQVFQYELSDEARPLIPTLLELNCHGDSITLTEDDEEDDP